MSTDSPSPLQDLVDRLRSNDAQARNDLFMRTYERLRGLARQILHQDFPTLRNAHEATSVANQAALRLWSALEQVQPATVEDFFGLAAVQIRRVLLDLARKQRPAALAPDSVAEAATETLDPARLAVWTEFHEGVDRLPSDERAVIHLCWYLGLTQREAAALLGIHEREVSRRWIRAIRKLPALAP
jgi:RNA polymerase sigma-70 factor (ECF subfamily)